MKKKDFIFIGIILLIAAASWGGIQWQRAKSLQLLKQGQDLTRQQAETSGNGSEETQQSDQVTEETTLATDQATEEITVSTEQATKEPTLLTDQATEEITVSTEQATKETTLLTDQATEETTLPTEQATEETTVSTEQATEETTEFRTEAVTARAETHSSETTASSREEELAQAYPDAYIPDPRPAAYLAVQITVGDTLIGIYPLDEDRIIPIGETNVCEIKDGQAVMSDAQCPDHLCMYMYPISGPMEYIACLPNQVLIYGLVMPGTDPAQDEMPAIDGIS